MREIKVALVVAVFLGMGFIELSAKRLPSFAGPFRVLVNSVMNVSDEYKSNGKAWVRLRTTQVRGKQLQYGWGQVFFGETLGDDYKYLQDKVIILRGVFETLIPNLSVLFYDSNQLYADMASFSNNQWKKNALVFNFDKACTALRTHAPSALRMLFGDHEPSCPIKAFGLREIRNQSFDLKFPHFPVAPYGKYRTTLVFLKGRNILGPIVAHCDVLPRL